MRRDAARGALGAASGVEERRERGALGCRSRSAGDLPHAVHLHLIVHVGAGGSSGVPMRAISSPALDALADTDLLIGIVGVERPVSVAVVDDHHVAVTPGAHPRTGLSWRRWRGWLFPGRRNVDSFMFLAPSRKGDGREPNRVEIQPCAGRMAGVAANRAVRRSRTIRRPRNARPAVRSLRPAPHSLRWPRPPGRRVPASTSRVSRGRRRRLRPWATAFILSAWATPSVAWSDWSAPGRSPSVLQGLRPVLERPASPLPRVAFRWAVTRAWSPHSRTNQTDPSRWRSQSAPRQSLRYG